MTQANILKTKLFIPPFRDDMIRRQELVGRIRAGISRKVVMVSAPAGFGKSTLLAEWAEQTELPVAWVSLDDAENDPCSFLSYLIAAVQEVYPELGDASLSSLNMPGTPATAPLLHAWINDISSHAQPFALILDDFHQITDDRAIDIICELIDNQPPQLHLMIASRADLPVSCARLRSRGELIELGIDDLRFNQEETNFFLENRLGDSISKADVQILGDRTEGWIAGLQMAVLSIASVDDIHQYVAKFSAQDRYIADYLVDEVLSKQPEEIQHFLLKTSILGKLSAPLCNHLLAINNSQGILEYLEGAGLFVIPLDTTRTWYRYHHLFAELLRLRLDNSAPEEIIPLHRKASDWFAEETLLDESINHAFAIDDYNMVITRIEKSLDLIVIQGQFRNYLAWVEPIPKELLREKPRLEIVKAFMLHEMGRLEERDQQLKLVENLLGPLPQDISKCSSGEVINHGILAAIKTIINASSYLLIEETHEFSELANRLLPEDFSLWRTLALGAIPFLHRALGDYKKSIEDHQKIHQMVMESGFVFMAFINYSVLIKSYLETGQLKLAMITCQKAVDLDKKHGANFPFAKLSYILMGELMYQTGQLSSAEAYVEMGLEHIVRHGDIYSIIDGYSILIRIQLAFHDGQEALALIREMKSVISELSPSTNAMKIINAWEKYTMLMAGRGKEVYKWIEEPGFENVEGKYLFDMERHAYVGIYRVSQNPIKIYNDFLKVTAARMYLVNNHLEKGLNIIESALKGMPEGGNTKFKIESLILKSLLLNEMNRKAEAISAFRQAIHLAAKEGFIQIFMSESVALKDLLDEVKETGLNDLEEQVFILRLLENIHLDSRKRENLMTGDPIQLTPREIEVLKCLATGLSYSQAAEQLSISRNTLKTHTKRIYQKLGVNGLLQALNKAKALNNF